MASAFGVIGATLRRLVNAGSRALRGGVFFVLIFVIVVIVGWSLVKRRSSSGPDPNVTDPDRTAGPTCKGTKPIPG